MRLHRLLVQNKNIMKEEWDKRLVFFKKLDDVLIQENMGTVHGEKERLQVLFVKSLDDHHMKVLIEVYRALLSMLRVSFQSLEPHLDQILPKIFGHAGSKKGELLQAARDTLEHI